MNADEFEQILRRQPLRRAPAEWREEILGAARQAGARPSALDSRPSLLSTLNAQLSTLLWPHSKAWAGLAAVWALTLILQYSAREPAASRPESLPPTPPQVAAVLRTQKQLLTDLLSENRTSDVEKTKPGESHPRSETRGRTSIG